MALLHPYTPFITEELWSFFKDKNSSDLIISQWPKENKDLIDEEVINTMGELKDIISSVRAVRSRVIIPPSK